MSGKRGATRLGLAGLLKFYTQYGRFSPGRVGAGRRSTQASRIRCFVADAAGPLPDVYYGVAPLKPKSPEARANVVPSVPKPSKSILFR
ncbi:hypothetical protein ACIQU4_39425 [Streptomyces sp. NPDC090741]|uniref:hypothetical protein n=1 Tax=Streptomyces sp. NPDC090741 TaxID=3365967 RepID=UPI0037F5A765